MGKSDRERNSKLCSFKASLVTSNIYLNKIMAIIPSGYDDKMGHLRASLGRIEQPQGIAHHCFGELIYERIRGEQKVREHLRGQQPFPIIATLQHSWALCFVSSAGAQAEFYINVVGGACLQQCVLVCMYVYMSLGQALHNPEIFHSVASIVRRREHRNSSCTLLHFQTRAPRNKS